MMGSTMAALGMALQLAVGTVPIKGPADARADARADATANAKADVKASPVTVPPTAGRAATGLMQQSVQLDASRFDSLTLIGLNAQLELAVENRLPTAPLINRAHEGAARRVSGAKILQVVKDHMAAMAHARDVLGPKSSADELDAGASALRSGIDLRTLSAIRETRPTGSTAVPLTVLTDIVVRRGVPESAAREAVNAIARMPSSDEALKGLQLTVAKNHLRGPGMAVDALNRYLRGTISGANPLAAPVTPDRKPNRPPPP